MRLANFVSVWGKAALLVFSACLNFAFADTLNYYYGYSSPNFGVYHSTDAFRSQNVSLAPQLPMITVQTQNQTSTFGSSSPSIFTQAANASTSAGGSHSSGYSILVQTYGYSVPATQGSSVSSATTLFHPSTASYTAPVAIASASTYTPIAIVTPQTVSGGIKTSSYYGSYTLPSGYAVGSSKTPSVTAYSSPTIGSSKSGGIVLYTGMSVASAPAATTATGGYIPIQIQLAVTPRYDTTITGPSTVSSPVTVRLAPTSPQITIGSISNPEPGTIGLFSAGLALCSSDFDAGRNRLRGAQAR